MIYKVWEIGLALYLDVWRLLEKLPFVCVVTGGRVMAVCSLVSQLFGSRFYLRHLSTCPRVSAESFLLQDFTGSSLVTEFTGFAGKL